MAIQNLISYIVLFIVFSFGTAVFLSKDKRYIKLFGAAFVGLLAISSGDIWAYYVSIFVAGLVIASERFMSVLAALLTRNKDFLLSENFSKMLEKMSGTEVAEKLQEEASEISKITEGDNQENKNIISPNNLASLEDRVMYKLKNFFGVEITRNYKLYNLRLDGLFQDATNQVCFIEIKAFPKVSTKHNSKAIRRVLTKTMNRIYQDTTIALDKMGTARWSYDYKIILVVALDNSKEIGSMYKEIHPYENLVEPKLMGEVDKLGSSVVVRLLYFDIAKGVLVLA